MLGFGRKQAWLAVRDRDSDAVAAALNLRDLGPVSWRDGIDLSYLTDDRLALTPLLPGAQGSRWLLVTGRWLLKNRGTLDLVHLSNILGTEVQLFGSYRVGELHLWQRASGGELVRAFEYFGETGNVREWRGDPDDTERAVGLPSTLDHDADVLVSEADVMRVARAWSIDPTDLQGRPALGPLRAAAAPDLSQEPT